MSRSRRRAWLMANFVVAACIVSGIDTAALADFRVCNQSSVLVNAAIGQNDPSLGWTARGWFAVPAGSCGNVISGRLTSSTYYIYGSSADGSEWAPHPGEQGETFCVAREKFTIPNRDRSVENVLQCGAGAGKRFKRVNTQGAANWTYTFYVRAPSSSTSTQAQPLPVSTAPPGGSDLDWICSYLAGEAHAACKGLLAENPQSSTPAPPPQAQPLPVPTAPRGRPAPSGSGCQRYPNLC
jgi:uncharacterized membrane protein